VVPPVRVPVPVVLLVLPISFLMEDLVALVGFTFGLGGQND
jgi:hypothetical protein